jgi:hypothetical protein
MAAGANGPGASGFRLLLDEGAATDLEELAFCAPSLRDEGLPRDKGCGLLRAAGGARAGRIRAAFSSRSGRSEDLEIGDSPPTRATVLVGSCPASVDLLTRVPFPGRVGAINASQHDAYDLMPIGQPASSGPLSADASASWVSDGGGVRQRDARACRRSYGWRRRRCSPSTSWPRGATSTTATPTSNQISPRSCGTTCTTGFVYDDNQFRTQPAQPSLQRSTYLQSARANGPRSGSPRPSSAAPYVWECCGRDASHVFNDMISTGIGGMALREMVYRCRRRSGRLEDRQGRRSSEGGGVPVVTDPRVHGSLRRALDRRTTRAIHGLAPPGEAASWPGRAHDRARRVHQRATRETTGYFEFTSSANAFDNERNKPYDSFDSTSSSTSATRWRWARPRWWARSTRRRSARHASRHVLRGRAALRLHEQRGLRVRRPELRPSLLSRFDLGHKWSL